jgi:hypothetical protein
MVDIIQMHQTLIMVDLAAAAEPELMAVLLVAVVAGTVVMPLMLVALLVMTQLH